MQVEQISLLSSAIAPIRDNLGIGLANRTTGRIRAMWRKVRGNKEAFERNARHNATVTTRQVLRATARRDAWELVRDIDAPRKNRRRMMLNRARREWRAV